MALYKLWLDPIQKYRNTEISLLDYCGFEKNNKCSVYSEGVCSKLINWGEDWGNRYLAKNWQVSFKYKNVISIQEKNCNGKLLTKRYLVNWSGNINKISYKN